MHAPTDGACAVGTGAHARRSHCYWSVALTLTSTPPMTVLDGSTGLLSSVAATLDAGGAGQSLASDRPGPGDSGPT